MNTMIVSLFLMLWMWMVLGVPCYLGIIETHTPSIKRHVFAVLIGGPVIWIGYLINGIWIVIKPVWTAFDKWLDK